MHLFGAVLTAEGIAANNRGENEGCEEGQMHRDTLPSQSTDTGSPSAGIRSVGRVRLMIHGTA